MTQNNRDRLWSPSPSLKSWKVQVCIQRLKNVASNIHGQWQPQTTNLPKQSQAREQLSVSPIHPRQVSACQACCSLWGWLSYSLHRPTYQTLMEGIFSGTHLEEYFHQVYSLSTQSSRQLSSAITTYDVEHLFIHSFASCVSSLEGGLAYFLLLC